MELANGGYYPFLIQKIGQQIINKITFQQILLPEDMESKESLTTNDTHTFLLWGLTLRLTYELLQLYFPNVPPIWSPSFTDSRFSNAILPLLEIWWRKKERNEHLPFQISATIGIPIILYCISKSRSKM
jgi:hypothetical protein